MHQPITTVPEISRFMELFTAAVVVEPIPLPPRKFFSRTAQNKDTQEADSAIKA
jgi:hypothetical protein